MAYIIDQMKLDDDRTRYLIMDDGKLEVRTYSKGRSPIVDEDHPHASKMKLSRYGNRVSLGDFAEAELGNHNTITYTKGDFAIRKILNSYFGMTDSSKYKDG